MFNTPFRIKLLYCKQLSLPRGIPEYIYDFIQPELLIVKKCLKNFNSKNTCIYPTNEVEYYEYSQKVLMSPLVLSVPLHLKITPEWRKWMLDNSFRWTGELFRYLPDCVSCKYKDIAQVDAQVHTQNVTNILYFLSDERVFLRLTYNTPGDASSFSLAMYSHQIEERTISIDKAIELSTQALSRGGYLEIHVRFENKFDLCDNYGDDPFLHFIPSKGIFAASKKWGHHSEMYSISFHLNDL